MNVAELRAVMAQIGDAPHGGRWRFIYALIDPETGLVRYIGKTVDPPRRLSAHIRERSNCHRSHWLQALRRKGLKPEMVFLEANAGAWPWQEAERHWIAFGRRHGWPLTNNTSGGDGVPDLPAETRRRMATTWKGRRHSPESLKKIGAASSGRRASPEKRAKMSASLKGRRITWGDKISDAIYKLTAEQAAEVRLRLLAGERVIDLAAELGLHRTTVSKIKMGTYRGRGGTP